MTFFTDHDHAVLTLGGKQQDAVQSVYNKLYDLHNTLHRRMRDHNIDLHPHWKPGAMILPRSASYRYDGTSLALSYLRPKEQAQLVERLMGRDGLEWDNDVEVYRHPVIELRLTPRRFAVELVLSPYAWWDQQNFIGKMALPRQRETFRNIIQRMNGEYLFGYFEGSDLSDMHVTTSQLLRGNYLNEWVSTFCDGQDWLRIGTWYEVEDPALDAGRLPYELIQRISSLYSVYQFMAWSSNNDFHSFYRKMYFKGSDALLS